MGVSQAWFYKWRHGDGSPRVLDVRLVAVANHHTRTGNYHLPVISDVILDAILAPLRCLEKPGHACAAAHRTALTVAYPNPGRRCPAGDNISVTLHAPRNRVTARRGRHVA